MHVGRFFSQLEWQPFRIELNLNRPRRLWKTGTKVIFLFLSEKMTSDLGFPRFCNRTPSTADVQRRRLGDCPRTLSHMMAHYFFALVG